MRDEEWIMEDDGGWKMKEDDGGWKRMMEDGR